MIKEALEYLNDLAKPSTFNLSGGKQYASRALVELPGPNPEPKPLALHTLASLIDLADFEGIEHCAIVVEDVDRVSLRSALHGDFDQRYTYATSTPFLPETNRGGFMDLDKFALHVQTGFVQDENTAILLQLLGNLEAGSVRKYADDGVSQTVSTRRGMAALETVKVPSPLELRPFRTFAEIEQPASKFVLRIRDDDDAPQAALFETNDKAWRRLALNEILHWFSENIREDSPIDEVLG